ncbi:MAG: carbon-nitrogen hydrolase family protein [Anaerolineaceae bacterium]|nr:MAG: carbon-nitrogen hydrolase family protein [Anaerolineaceae bacterium]
MPTDANVKNMNGSGTSVHVAAIQMDANAAPTADRMARAEQLVAGAAAAGAQLILLPECFNTGYTFSEENHARVERIDGLTATWLRETASRLNIHLAGSLMLLDQGEVYNALLLFTPDGQLWRYDKNYPWGWEQAYFRTSKREPNVTIAETDLGRIGMLICWDVSHPNLWHAYAGRVDLMLISSCPVDAGHATYHFPNGDNYTLDDLGSRSAAMADLVTLAFGDMMNQQAAWLGVPAVHAIASGHVHTELPMARRAMIAMALNAPWLLKYLPQANGMQMSCDAVQECKIINSGGEIFARLSEEDGEAFVTAEVQIASSRQAPHTPQPATPIPDMSYFFVDRLLPAIVKPVYRKGQRMWSSS